MNKNVITSISVEDFAAYLDGNLSVDSIRQIESLIQDDSFVHEIFDASQIIEQNYNRIVEEGFEIPPELLSNEFDIPNIDNDLSYTNITSGNINDNISDDISQQDDNPNTDLNQNSNLIALDDNNFFVTEPYDDQVIETNNDNNSDIDLNNNFSI